MSAISIAPSGLPLQYADIFGIPRSISKPLLTSVEMWIKSCSEEWTVSRLKSIKLDFVRMKAGLSPVSPWVSRRDGHFTGALGALESWSKGGKKRWSKTIQFLNSYTLLYSSEVTSKQMDKFLSGVRSEPVCVHDSVKYRVVSGAYKLGLKGLTLCNTRPLVMRLPSQARREPHANGRSYWEGDASLECAVSFTRYTRIGWDFSSRFSSIFNVVEEGIDVDDHRDADVTDYPNSVGKIGFIQEPGYKLRAVANPARVYQEALRPLGRCLFDTLRSLPWDCTHRQDYPIPAIQGALQRHQMVYSVDLTGATDYFPLELQAYVLNSIVNPVFRPHVELFTRISKSPWRFGEGFLTWTKGQPLGLYPSFAAFAMTHGLLLYALNGYRHEDSFFVLGDDVVILKSDLYHRYLDALCELGCPISEHKSICSASLAEFAGVIVTRFGVTHQFKWRSPSDDSFLDVIRNFGPKALSILRPRQRVVAKLMANIPDFMGGLGWNPSGVPLEDRVYQALSTLPQDRHVGFLMGYNRKISRDNYPLKSPPPYLSVRTTKDDLDLRSLAYVRQYLPSLINWYELLGSNLWTITDGNLPLAVASSEGHETTLEHFERVFERR